MQQILQLFQEPLASSGQSSGPSSKIQTPLSLKKAKKKNESGKSSASVQIGIHSSNKLTTQKISSQSSPYGVCHRCDRPFQTPGLDRSYCKNCGWVGGNV